MPALRTLTIQMFLLTAFAMTATAVTFDVPAEYSVGDSPNRICSADFNGDGHLDLAVTRVNFDLYHDPDPNNAVVIMISNGDGTFALPVVYSAGEEPFAICAADIDNDDDIDIIVTNYMPGLITVLVNDGSGVFSIGSSTATAGNFCRSLCAADFDGDNDNDVAVVSAGEDSVCILLNLGDGSFTRDTAFAVGEEANWVCAADFNKDGRPDLAVASCWGPAITIFTNDGNGGFSLDAICPVGDGPYTVVATDVDNDADIDLAVASQASDCVSILRNNGDGSFALFEYYPVLMLPVSLCPADFDGDGFVDLAVTCHALDSVSILTNNGDGTFTVDSKYTSGVLPICVATGDFDDDGLSDMVVVNHSSDCIRVFINNTVVSDIADEFTPTDLPANCQLRQNYPNPFNPSTTIGFDLPGRSIVQITVYNISGQAVRRLVNAELGAGTHTVEWDGTNDFGQPVATGIYLCHFKAGDISAVKKMALLK